VAIVDDHETMRALMSMLLTRARVDFVVCSDGGEILARCREGERYRVILLDRHMQTVGGDETTRLLRAMGISSAVTTIVGLTAEDSPGEMSDYLAAGLDAVYKKPLLPKHWSMIAQRYLADAVPLHPPRRSRVGSGGGGGDGGSGSEWRRSGAQPPLTPLGNPRRTTPGDAARRAARSATPSEEPHSTSLLPRPGASGVARFERGAKNTTYHLDGMVSVLLFTVTFHANRAHNLTRPP
jgi:CheY-like chemotaxis protein